LKQDKGMQILGDIDLIDATMIMKMAISRFSDCDLKCIGEGVYGRVLLYVGREGRKYAIKVFKSNYSMLDMDDIDKLLALQGCEHYPKVFMYQRGSFMVTEFIDGRTLYEIHCIQERSFANRLRKPIIDKMENPIEQYKNAYKYALSRGFAPYDTHGDNIMVTPHGRLVIVDVGCFAKFHRKLIIPMWASENKKKFSQSELLQALKADKGNFWGYHNGVEAIKECEIHLKTHKTNGQELQPA